MTSNKAHIRTLLLCGCAFGAWGLGVANARAADTSSSTTVGEVVVTAQRRSERLQDVPASISVVSRAAIAKAGINSTEDLSRASPSLNVQFYGSFMQPAIRGVSSTGAAVGDNSNVALYIDGVYQPMQQATLIDLPDVEQIEILKGPQGALYGQNATGGAILVNSFSPKFTPTARASISYGNYNAVDARAYVSGPINDYFAVSLTGGYDDHEGFRTQVVTGQRDLGLHSNTLRGKLLFKPSDSAKITLAAYYTRRSDSASYASFAINNNTYGNNFFLTPVPAVTNPHQYGTDPRANSDTKEFGGSLRGEFNVAGGTFTTISAITKSRNTYFYDADSSPANFYDGFQPHNTSDYFTQEVDYTSGNFGPFSASLGAFYLKGNEESGSPTLFVTTGLHFPVTLMPAPPTPAAPNHPGFQGVDKEIYAAYGELTYHVTDKLTLTAGGRYSSETQSGYYAVPPSSVVFQYPLGPATWTKFTPRITARYQLTPTSNVYASYNQGFKSGVLYPSADPITKPVSPETISAYEIGYKGQILPNLSVNAALYHYDYTNMQFVIFEPLLLTYKDQNAASSSITGADIDAIWNVTHDFTLTANLAFLQAKFVKFPAAQIFLPTGSLAALLHDREWRAFVYAERGQGVATGAVGQEPRRLGLSDERAGRRSYRRWRLCRTADLRRARGIRLLGAPNRRDGILAGAWLVKPARLQSMSGFVPAARLHPSRLTVSQRYEGR